MVRCQEEIKEQSAAKSSLALFCSSGLNVGSKSGVQSDLCLLNKIISVLLLFNNKYRKRLMKIMWRSQWEMIQVAGFMQSVVTATKC